MSITVPRPPAQTRTRASSGGLSCVHQASQAMFVWSLVLQGSGESSVGCCLELFPPLTCWVLWPSLSSDKLLTWSTKFK